MVNYRLKLGIDFDLSGKQIEILEKNSDTLVRAVPGSGKTTILTLKIKKLLMDNPDINQLCCISYTNVNVDDLESSCAKKIDNSLLDKIDFLTFHRFCLQYILNPFSYLYRSNSGFRPYKEIFNFKEHGLLLLDYLKMKNIDESEINQIIKDGSIFYNFKYQEPKWIPFSDKLAYKTLVGYLNFLNDRKLIDFNLINLLSLFIIQQNDWVRRALNKSIDWILIDEFQDVTDIQCRIVEELRKSRKSDSKELKWFLVGDPNQSIYGFAGANPRSMYDIKKVFNSLNGGVVDCEIKLDRTHRCPNKIFNFARSNYNEVLSKINSLIVNNHLCDPEVVSYLNDLEISQSIQGSAGEGDVIIKNTISSSGVEDIVNLRINELVGDDVCCIGITKYHSIDVYKQYKTLPNIDSSDDFRLYSDIYRDFEDIYGFKYFSLYISNLMLRYNFFNNRIKFSASVKKHLYFLDQFIYEKIPQKEGAEEKLLKILVDSCDLKISLKSENNIFDEFEKFVKIFSKSLKETFPENENIFSEIANLNIKNLEGVSTPTVSGFIDFIAKISSNKKSSFEIKHIHKIKGLEYDQVIVQKTEDLPYKSNYKINGDLFYGKNENFTKDDVYNYLQDMNKLYVMLTRAKKNLYLIINDKKHPVLINLDR